MLYLVLVLSCLMRSRDAHSGLTHAPFCSLHSFCQQHQQTAPLLGLILSHEQLLSSVIEYCLFFLFVVLSFLNHIPLTCILTHANGTLSSSSLRCSVGGDSQQWIY